MRSSEEGLSPIVRTEFDLSPDLLKSLQRFGVSLSVLSIEELKDLTLGRFGIEGEPFLTHVSTPEQPQVLIEYGAGSCSMLVAIDNKGNIISVHQPLVYRSVESLSRTLEECGYLKALAENVGSERLIFLTGTNMNTEDQEKLVQNLELVLGLRVNYLFVKKPSADQNQDPKRLNQINKIVIIPAAVSKTSQVELIIPTIAGPKLALDKQFLLLRRMLLTGK